MKQNNIQANSQKKGTTELERRQRKDRKEKKKTKKKKKTKEKEGEEEEGRIRGTRVHYIKAQNSIRTISK